MGRIGLKSLVYFEVLTTIALLIGLAAIDLSKAGVGLNMAAAHTAAAAAYCRHSHYHLAAIPAARLSREHRQRRGGQPDPAGRRLRIFFGLALCKVPEARRAPMLRLCESLTEVMFAFTNIVMLFAPSASPPRSPSPSRSPASA